MTAVVLDLIEKDNVSVIFIPHDRRPHGGDYGVIGAIAERVNASQHVCMSPLQTAAEVKHLTSLLDVTITGRMHLAISSLGSHTPALMIGGTEKMPGLLRKLALPANWAFNVRELASDKFLLACRVFIAASDENRKLLPSATFNAKLSSNLNLMNFDLIGRSTCQDS